MSSRIEGYAPEKLELVLAAASITIPKRVEKPAEDDNLSIA